MAKIIVDMSVESANNLNVHFTTILTYIMAIHRAAD
jgi:hypothetical protein